MADQPITENAMTGNELDELERSITADAEALQRAIETAGAAVVKVRAGERRLRDLLRGVKGKDYAADFQLFRLSEVESALVAAGVVLSDGNALGTTNIAETITRRLSYALSGARQAV